MRDKIGTMDGANDKYALVSCQSRLKQCVDLETNGISETRKLERQPTTMLLQELVSKHAESLNNHL